MNISIIGLTLCIRCLCWNSKKDPWSRSTLERSMLATVNHFCRLTARITHEVDFLRDLKADARGGIVPPIRISPELGRFIQIRLKAASTKEVVEMGRLADWSAIRMAGRLSVDDNVRTIEVFPRRVDFEGRWISESDVAGRIKLRRVNREEILRQFASSSVGAAFTNAEKTVYPSFLRGRLGVVRRERLTIADKIFRFGRPSDDSDPEAAAMHPFKDQLVKGATLWSIIALVGNRLWLGL